jgi:acyl dehydratase
LRAVAGGCGGSLPSTIGAVNGLAGGLRCADGALRRAARGIARLGSILPGWVAGRLGCGPARLRLGSFAGRLGCGRAGHRIQSIDPITEETLMPEAVTAPSVVGRYFEEFAPGYTAVSPSRTITESDVCAFAGLSGDYNPLHTDAEFARETPFGERIAHGMLGLSAATGLASRLGFIDGTALAFLGLDWKFRKPILFGDTIHLVVKVLTTRPWPAMGGGVVNFSVRVVNNRDEIVQKGSWSILVRSRPDSDGEADGAGA